MIVHNASFIPPAIDVKGGEGFGREGVGGGGTHQYLVAVPPIRMDGGAGGCCLTPLRCICARDKLSCCSSGPVMTLLRKLDSMLPFIHTTMATI